MNNKTTCRKCKGSTYHIKNYIPLIEVCRSCGGIGRKDWVDNLLNTKVKFFDIERSRETRLKNIQLLTRYLIEEAVLIGVNIDVVIKTMEFYNPEITYEEAVNNNYGDVMKVIKTGTEDISHV